jgi:5-hydroxyisourate hydrolase
MTGGISLHAVDVASGQPAAGMRVELFLRDEAGEQLLASGTLSRSGALDHPMARGELPVTIGTHEAHFHVGDWLRSQDPELGRVFMEVAILRFEVLDPAQHVHLPLKFSRWGLALFRGS